MADIVVNGNTSGAVTLSAPAVAGTVTVTLPSTTGTMLTTASTTGISGSAISSGTVPEAYGGTGTSTGYYGFKNRIINGAMVIDQRNAGAAIASPSDNYTTDRFYSRQVGGGVASAQQSSTAPTGFVNSLLFTVTTPDSSIVTTDRYYVAQFIEGYNTADFAFGTASASYITLSFWVRSSLTGTFGGAIRNSGASRSYPFTYTINAANTFEQKTITIAGDTSGTWLTTNGVGIQVIFSLGMGPTYSGTAGAWASADYLSATGATNVIATNGATFYITGVQLEKGSTATSFDYRPIGTELALCQRYCYVANGQGAIPFVAGAAVSSTNVILTYTLPVLPRATPTLTFSGSIVISDQYITDIGSSSVTVVVVPNAPNMNGRVQLGGFSGLTTGRFYGGAPNLNGITTFSMEL